MQQYGSLKFLRSMGRAAGGALMFSLPLLMMMEMWHLGFYVDRVKLAILVIATLPVLTGLSFFSGFEKTTNIFEDAIDALVAFTVGALLTVVVLAVLGVITADMTLDAVVGKVILLTLPASIGAVLASKRLEQRDDSNEEPEEADYSGILFIMAAGALLLAFNVAPTEEISLIAYNMTAWHALVLTLLTLLIMHSIVYMVAFRGQKKGESGGNQVITFYHFSLVGYAIALLISAYALWTFGRFDGNGAATNVIAIVVLGFPAGIGAAVSRLVL